MKRPIPFGKYFLLERINVGGMAEVFKAKTYGVEGFERLLAVKRILPNIAEDEEFITMFIDEAKIAVQLNHANIAQIFDLGKVDDSYFIALEYVHGKDLRAIFDRLGGISETMPIPQACFIIMKVCEGLDYAHNKRDSSGNRMHLVHRDVSPQNVLISYEGEVKLVDFGIAKAVGKASKTEAGILKGKFGYMSPEQVRGLPLDRRSDIFSMGIVLYELLTGERLFLGESDFSTLEKVRNVEILPPSAYNRRVGDELEQIVLKALAKDVDDRYQNAIDLHDDLQAYMYTSGQFYSRKDLANWMKRTWAREIEEEGRKLEEYRRLQPPPPPPPSAAKKRTLSVPHAPPAPPQPDPPGGNGHRIPALGPTSPPLAATLPPATPVSSSDGMMVSPPVGDKNSLPAMAWDDDEVETQIYDKPPSGMAATLDITPAPDVSPLAGPPLSRSERNPPGIASPVNPGTGWGSPVRSTQHVAPLDVPRQPLPVTRRSPQIALWITLALLVVVVCAGVLYYYMYYSIRPGNISVISDPREVKVFLDGKEQPGTSTPLTIRSLKPGPYIISVMKEGYSRWTNTVEVKPGKTIRLTPRLNVMATATIELRTIPSGGEAFLDDRKLDGHTPMRISEVTPGKHRLEVRKPPFQSWVHDFDIKPEQVLRLNGRLLPAEVEVQISSKPTGQIFLITHGKLGKEDRKALQGSPATVRLDPKLRYTVVIEREGYEQWRQPLRIDSEGPVKVSAVLSRKQSQVSPPDLPEPRQVSPRIKPKPPVRIRPRPKPSPRPRPKPTPIAPKPQPDEPSPQPVGMGTLLINSNPWTRIYVDNRDTGLTTPQLRIPLPAGRHKVTLRNPKFNINVSFNVMIRPGEQTKVIKKNLGGTTP